MKNLIPIVLIAFLAGSCVVDEVEPRSDHRNRFVGYFDAEEYSETYHDITFYELRISKSGFGRDLIIDNFYGAGLRVRAYVSYNDIVIPFQVEDGYEIEGSGTLYGNELRLTYRINDVYDYSAADYCDTRAWR